MIEKKSNHGKKIVIERGRLKMLMAVAQCEKPYASECLSGKARCPSSKKVLEVRRIAMEQFNGRYLGLVNPKSKNK